MGKGEEGKTEGETEVSTKKHPGGKKRADEDAGGKSRKKEKEVRISEKALGEVKEKAALADQYFDRLLRLQAEFENFRKRKEKERLDVIKYATEGLVCELVPILGDFERAVAAAEKSPPVKSFADGVEMILKQLKKVLKEHGMEEICPINAPFDPHKHEAVDRVITNDHPEGHVVEVFQTGYALNDRVLLPAAVKVAAAPPPPASSSKTDEKESDFSGSGQVEEHPEEGSKTETSQDEIEEERTNG
jgi:molecular chaperone GrpE